MAPWLWVVAVVTMLCCLTAGAVVFFRFMKKRNSGRGRIAGGIVPGNGETGRGLGMWRFLAVGWPLACVCFGAIIIGQPDRVGEECLVDTMFTIFPLIFFAIGMAMEHRLLKEKQYATVLTSALVVSVRRHVSMGSGSRSCYFPEYEFQVGQITYHVKSPGGFDRSYVKEGERVELYYAPDNPHVFYVPVMRKHDKRWAALLCGVGILFPLAGLFAPWIRQVSWFLET